MRYVNRFGMEYNLIQGVDYVNSFITIGIRGGYVNRYYSRTDGTNRVEINNAASIVFCAYLNRVFNKKSIRIEVGKYGIYITIPLNDEIDLVSVFKQVYDIPFSESLFDEVKAKSIEAFRLMYKNPLYRSSVFINEFTDQRKQFIYNSYAFSLENITYKDIQLFQETIVTPENSIVFANGVFDDLALNRLLAATKCIKKCGHRYTHIGMTERDLRYTDRFLLEDSNCENLEAEYFEFSKDNVSLIQQLVWMFYINEIWLGGTGYISIDYFDASILYRNPKQINIEIGLVEEWDIKKVEAAKTKLLLNIKKKVFRTDEFGHFCGEFYFSGINTKEAIKLIFELEPEAIVELHRKIDFKAYNAAIIKV